jgi:hypothetical protein
MYEGTITYTTVDNKGNDKNVKENYILEHCESFSDAEEQLFNDGDGRAAIDVVAIKRSPLKEIVNERENEEQKVFIATIIDKFYDADKDETTETKYNVALFAVDIAKAHQVVNEYMKQGLEDMELVGLKCTKIVDVLR